MTTLVVCIRVACICVCTCVCMCVCTCARERTCRCFLSDGVKNEGDITGVRVVFDPRCFKIGVVLSTSWKLGLCFVCILIVDWNFLTKFFSSHSRFNRNNLISLYLKSETSAHVQLRNYSFIHTIYKFPDVVSVGNLHQGYLLINGVYR